MGHCRILILSALLLPIAACSSEKTAEENGPPSPVTEAAQTPPSIPAPEPTDTAPAKPAAQSRADQIPAPIQGRWGLIAADCTTRRGDAKGLLIIDTTSLQFYESVGKLMHVREHDPSRIVGEFAFSGEGANWNRVMTLDVQDGGQTLIRRENGQGAAPGPMQYRRCEG